MLVRIDPQTHYISLLSLPRDLWVDIPGYGENKINAAYEQGGVKLALKTVESVTGVDVNYLMVVDFSGFTRLVNAFGGVYVPVDQYYQHTNTPGTEQYAQIDVKPGYQLLHGTDALGFARYRHTDSDFYRNARQQTFLQAFQARASEKLHGIDLTEIGTYKDIAETIADSVQVTGRNGPPSVQTMISYATLAYESRGHVVSSRLTAGAGMIGDASVVTTTPEDMHTAVYAFTHPQSLAKPTVPTGKKPANTSKFKPAVEPAGVSLTSVNGNGRHRLGGQGGRGAPPLRIPGRRQPGAGADVRLLAELGLLPFRPAEGRDRRCQDHGQRADCARAGHFHLRHRPGRHRRQTFQGHDGDPSAQAVDADRAAGRHRPRLTGVPELLPDREAQPALPGALPDGAADRLQFDDFTTEMPIRAYNIAAAGKGWNSMYAVFAMPEPRRCVLGDRGDPLRRRADPGQPRPDPQAGRPHLPVLLQRHAHPHDRHRPGRHRLLGAEHASRRPLEPGHDRDRPVAASPSDEPERQTASADRRDRRRLRRPGHGGLLRRPGPRRGLPSTSARADRRRCATAGCRSTSRASSGCSSATASGSTFTLDMAERVRAAAGWCSCASTRRPRTPATPTCRACTA